MARGCAVGARTPFVNTHTCTYSADTHTRARRWNSYGGCGVWSPRSRGYGRQCRVHTTTFRTHALRSPAIDRRPASPFPPDGAGSTPPPACCRRRTNRASPKDRLPGPGNSTVRVTRQTDRWKFPAPLIFRFALDLPPTNDPSTPTRFDELLFFLARVSTDQLIALVEESRNADAGCGACVRTFAGVETLARSCNGSLQIGDWRRGNLWNISRLAAEAD